MFTSLRRSRPARRAALLAAAIVLVAAGSASARSGTSSSGHSSSHSDGHRASLASPVRLVGPPIMKPGDKHHHHHHHLRFFNDWYWARACVAPYPPLAMRRVDPRWYGLSRCRVIDETAAY
jgi:hypothetical protein